jgi:WD40 repeat protein
VIPAGLPCRVLFTTRRRDLGRSTPVKVTVLPEDAALQLLLRHPQRQNILNPAHPEHAVARDICATLGYLPLALEIAGAHLGRRPDAPLAAYRRELERRGALPVLDDPRARLRPEGLGTRYDAAVAATLAGQWEALEGEETRLLLRVLGQLPEAALVPVPRLGLLAGLEEREGSFFGSLLALALQELEDASLVERLGENRVRLHPLVHAFAAQCTPPDEMPAFRQGCAARLLAAYEEIATLEEHCARRGVDALEADLRVGLALLPPSPASGGGERHSDGAGGGLSSRLSALLRLLQREAHVLRDWEPGAHPAFFAQQVLKRARYMGLERLAADAGARLQALNVPHLALRWRAGRESRALERTLTGHESAVRAVAVTPDGRCAVSASGRTLVVWDLQSGQALRTRTWPEARVNAVAVTPDGRRAVSTSDDRTLKVWDLDSGRQNRTLRRRVSLVRIWRRLVWDEEERITAVVVTPDGRRAVSASSSRTLVVWDLETGQELRTLTGHKGRVNAVAVTPDGRRAVSASWDRTLKVWDLGTGQEECTLTGHEKLVNAVAVTPDGRRAVSASDDRTLVVWDLQSGQALRTLTRHEAGAHIVAVTPDGRRAVSASWDRTLVAWDLQSGQAQGAALRTLSGHESSVYAVAVTPNGRRAVSASDDRTFKVWDFET